MTDVVQTILKHPGDPDRTLEDVLHDVAGRNELDRKLVSFTIKPTAVELVYKVPG